jgi:hypothetical protein
MVHVFIEISMRWGETHMFWSIEGTSLMRGPFLLVVLVGVLPLIIFASIVAESGLGLVLWQPPNIWRTQFGPINGASGVTALSVDSSGLYVTGYSVNSTVRECGPEPCALVARYDLNGRQVWIRTFSQPFSQFNSIAVGGNNVIVGGILNGSSSVQRYDLDGNLIWAANPAKDHETMSVSIQTDVVYSAGLGPRDPQAVSPFIIHRYDLYGSVIWTRLLGGANSTFISAYATSSGVYVGRSDLTNIGETYARVSKYDQNGNLNWTRQLNDPPLYNACRCGISGVTGDETGVYVTGYVTVVRGLIDGFVRKFDPAGSPIWSVQFSAPDHSGVESLGVSADSSGVYLAETTAHGATFLMKYDGNGGSLWSFETQSLSHTSSSLGVAAGAGSIFLGGDLRIGNDLFGYVARFSQSSSLVLFGLNPPFSFLLLGSLVAALTVSILLFRRRKLREARSAMRKRGTATSSSRHIP